ncbi:MAG: deoxynucleoside kinase [Fibrobacteraceae bacterium]|nr:deoxynucleoside kinase [Fibrobacteraceae bacterium]
MLKDKGVHFLAIEGVIGVGKTALARIISERWNALCIEENYAQNPFLEKFYENPEPYAFQTQLFFLLDRHKQLQNSALQSDLFHDLLVSDYTYDKDAIFAAQNLTDSEYAMYETVAKSLDKDLPRPDLVVYLQASVPTLLNRIKSRGREMEKTIEGSYLKDLQARYDHHFWHYRNAPVIIINTDNIDFVHNESHLQMILEIIESCPTQTTYFVPTGN